MATPAPKVVVPIVIAETAFAGTVNSDESKIVTNKVEDFLFQELLMLNPNSVKSCH